MTRAFAAGILLAIPFSASAQTSFDGYVCTQNCSGPQTGYNWAKRKDIESEDDCGGNCNSFIEGCKAYVEERTDETKVDAEEKRDE